MRWAGLIISAAILVTIGVMMTTAGGPGVTFRTAPAQTLDMTAS